VPHAPRGRNESLKERYGNDLRTSLVQSSARHARALVSVMEAEIVPSRECCGNTAAKSYLQLAIDVGQPLRRGLGRSARTAAITVAPSGSPHWTDHLNCKAIYLVGPGHAVATATTVVMSVDARIA